eukprot:COSAG01_NODE_41976_length_445_cov_0.505780_2_plen_21_part_01
MAVDRGFAAVVVGQSQCDRRS